MLHFQIEFGSGLSVYRQLVEQVRFYIASGTLRAGDKLPSVRGLSKELGINPATVVKAYNILQNDEVIELRQGRGAFVLQSEVKEKKMTDAHFEELDMKAKAIALLASQLSLSEGELQDIVLTHYRNITHD